MDKKELSFSEQVFVLSNPAPDRDIEDFLDEETSATVISTKSDDWSHDLSHDKQPSQLRRNAAVEFGSLQHDSRYKGLKTSRAKLQEFSDDRGEGEQSASDYEEGFVVTADEDIAESMSDEYSDGEEEWEEADNEDAQLSFDDNAEDVDNENEGGSQDGEEEDEEKELSADSGIQGFSQVNMSAEVEKGQAVKSQLGMWDSLMQARIKLHKALSITNQLPQPNIHQAFISQGGKEVTTLMQNSEKKLSKLVQSFVHLQDTLLKQNSETEHVLQNEQSGSESCISPADEEEIPSESDGEIEGVPSPGSAVQLSQASVKRSLDGREIEEHLAKRHRSFESFRNATMQKWYEKTRLSTGKLSKKSFSGFERSALQQIQQVLQDRQRLVKRTQLRRSDYTVLGEESRGQQEEEGSEGNREKEPANQHLKNYDPEIFDDNDFYHQLLRELIEKRTSSTTDPIQLTRQWLQVQKLRSKVKRIVDTKASKGRKLRYDVHQKLVSFMAPVNNSTMPVEARSELFKSLFGQTNMPSIAGR